jgi:prevent-host-death family protein
MKATAADVGRSFHEYLSRVMHGGVSVEITYHGRRAAVLSPMPGKMSGKELAKIFRRHQADAKTGNAVKRILQDQDEHERKNFDRHVRVR